MYRISWQTGENIEFEMCFSLISAPHGISTHSDWQLNNKRLTGHELKNSKQPCKLWVDVNQADVQSSWPWEQLTTSTLYSSWEKKHHRHPKRAVKVSTSTHHRWLKFHETCFRCWHHDTIRAPSESNVKDGLRSKLFTYWRRTGGMEGWIRAQRTAHSLMKLKLKRIVGPHL